MRLQFLLSLMVTLDLLFSCIQVSSTKNRAQSNDSDSNRQGHELSSEKLLGLLLDNPIYNYKIPPQYDTDIPVMVDVQLLIMSFDSVNELSMDLQMNIFLLQIWKDSRLDFSHLSKMEKLELDIKMMNNVWVPDTFFRNEKYGEMHRVTKPNKLMHLLRDGTVYYSVRLTATLSCNMNLQNYPLDDQKCPIVLSSYGYSSRNLIYRWLPRAPVLYDDEMQLAQYSLKNHHLRNYTKTHETGSFSCLRVDFMLQRKIGYYIIQVYVPSTLVVILSWVSFWIDIEAIPARISLGVVTVLTITTQASGMSSTPRVSYIKAIDVWMASCLVFVFMTVLEFAYINVVIRRYKVTLSCLTELPSHPVLALSSHTPEMSSERLPDSQKVHDVG